MPHTFKLGLDVDLHNIVTAIQCDRGTIALAYNLKRVLNLVSFAQLMAAVQNGAERSV